MASKFILLPACSAGHVDAIKEEVTKAGFKILQERQYQLTPDEAHTFYAEHAGKPFFSKLIDFMTSGEIVALQLERTDAVTAWRTLCGPTNSEIAKAEAPASLRAKFGTGTFSSLSMPFGSIWHQSTC